ncbi:MAG: hypothetical protein KGL39_13350 [Patescibacteria group bacterium]|nr:hypothetical protein [Patescibacteria group bacterium]
MTTSDLKKTLTDLRAAVATADDSLDKLATDEHLKKCPLVASTRVATSAAITRLDNAIAWLDQNPIPAAVPAAPVPAAKPSAPAR